MGWVVSVMERQKRQDEVVSRLMKRQLKQDWVVLFTLLIQLLLRGRRSKTVLYYPLYFMQLWRRGGRKVEIYNSGDQLRLELVT